MDTQVPNRRRSTRDRRMAGDRRSSVLPNITAFSRRITLQDRRGVCDDRRINARNARYEAMQLSNPLAVTLS